MRTDWMNAARLTLLLATALGTGGAIGACSPDSPPPDDGPATPLDQTGRIPVQISLKGAFVTVHPTQAALEQVAALYCNAQRSFSTDTQICGGIDRYTRIRSGILAKNETAADNLVAASPDKCGDGLCFERNEVCAGYTLEELAKSPIPRLIDPSQFPAAGLTFTLSQLALTETELAGLGYRGIAGNNVQIPQIKFLPVSAPGRAASFRGALNRYRRSTRVAEVMRTADGTPVGAGKPTTCDVVFAARDQANQATPFIAGPDAHKPGWSDVWVNTFVDGATQYTGLVKETLAAMRESTDSQINGGASDATLVETQWNGKFDSAVAGARLLAFGESTLASNPAGTGTGIQGKFGTTNPVSFYFQTTLGSNATPEGTPTCPPSLNNPGVATAVQWAKQLHIGFASRNQESKDLGKTVAFKQTFVDAYNEDQFLNSGLANALDAPTVYARLHLGADPARAATDRGTATCGC